MREEITVNVAKTPIVPEVIVWNNRVYEIVGVHPCYVIKKYSIQVDDCNRIENVSIYNSWHPNAGQSSNQKLPINEPPEKSEFCLPPDLVGSEYEGEPAIKFLERYVLGRWDLDDPHHYPNYLHYKSNPPLEGRNYVW